MTSCSVGIKDATKQIHHKHLLFVTGRLSPWSGGGTGQVLKNLANTLSETPNFEVHLLGAVPKGTFPDEIYENYSRITGIKIAHTYGNKDSMLDVLMSHCSYIIKTVRDRKQYDIVQFNVLPGLRTIIVFVILRLKNRSSKFILNLHDLPPLEVHIYLESKMKMFGAWRPLRKSKRF